MVAPPPEQFSAGIKWGWFHEILDNLSCGSTRTPHEEGVLRKTLEERKVAPGAIDLSEARPSSHLWLAPRHS